MTSATACGKVILLGEHSVVYGRPALAAAIPDGAEAQFAPDGADALTLEITPWDTRVSSRDDSDVGRAIRALCDALPGGSAKRIGGVVRATMRLPGGGGLGSSAALGVAIARTVGEHLVGRPLGEAETLSAALAWETVFHGNPSGVDHTLATLGGAGTYSRGEGFVPIKSGKSLRLVLGDTGERSRTKDMVASVARIHSLKPEATEKTFDAIAALVRNGSLAFASGDLPGLGQLMDLNQALLSSLLLSTERTEQLCRAAREAGAFGAKLTGGGGGGCVIALADERASDVVNMWRKLDAPSFTTELSGSAP